MTTPNLNLVFTDNKSYSTHSDSLKSSLLQSPISTKTLPIILHLKTQLTSNTATPLSKILMIRFIKQSVELADYKTIKLVESQLLPVLMEIGKYKSESQEDNRGKTMFIDQLKNEKDKNQLYQLGHSVLRLTLQLIKYFDASLSPSVYQYYDFPSMFSVVNKHLVGMKVKFPTSYLYIKPQDIDKFQKAYKEKTGERTKSKHIEKFIDEYSKYFISQLKNYEGDLGVCIRLVATGDSNLIEEAVDILDDYFQKQNDKMKLRVLEIVNLLFLTGEAELINELRMSFLPVLAHLVTGLNSQDYKAPVEHSTSSTRDLLKRFAYETLSIWEVLYSFTEYPTNIVLSNYSNFLPEPTEYHFFKKNLFSDEFKKNYNWRKIINKSKAKPIEAQNQEQMDEINDFVKKFQEAVKMNQKHFSSRDFIHSLELEIQAQTIIQPLPRTVSEKYVPMISDRNIEQGSMKIQKHERAVESRNSNLADRKEKEKEYYPDRSEPEIGDKKFESKNIAINNKEKQMEKSKKRQQQQEIPTLKVRPAQEQEKIEPNLVPEKSQLSEDLIIPNTQSFVSNKNQIKKSQIMNEPINKSKVGRHMQNEGQSSGQNIKKETNGPNPVHIPILNSAILPVPVPAPLLASPTFPAPKQQVLKQQFKAFTKRQQNIPSFPNPNTNPNIPPIKMKQTTLLLHSIQTFQRKQEQSLSVIQQPQMQPLNHSYHQIEETDREIMQRLQKEKQPSFMMATSSKQYKISSKINFGDSDNFNNFKNLKGRSSSKYSNIVPEPPLENRKAELDNLVSNIKLQYEDRINDLERKLSVMLEKQKSYVIKFNNQQSEIKSLRQEVSYLSKQNSLITNKNEIQYLMNQNSALKFKLTNMENSKHAPESGKKLSSNSFIPLNIDKPIGTMLNLNISNLDLRFRKCILRNKQILYKSSLLEVGVISNKEPGHLKITLFYTFSQNISNFRPMLFLENSKPRLVINCEDKQQGYVAANKQQKQSLTIQIPKHLTQGITPPTIKLLYTTEASLKQQITLYLPISLVKFSTIRKTTVDKMRAFQNPNNQIFNSYEIGYSKKIIKDINSLTQYYPQIVLVNPESEGMFNDRESNMYYGFEVMLGNCGFLMRVVLCPSQTLYVQGICLEREERQLLQTYMRDLLGLLIKEGER